MNPKTRRIEERIVYSDPSNPWVKLYFDRVEFPDGKEGHYNRIVEGTGVDGVAVLPLKKEMIGLVCQYRYPVGREMWEIPRGFGESDDAKLDAARELREETGIVVRPESLIALGCLHPNSGLLQTNVQLFAADCDMAQYVNPIEDDEVSQIRWITAHDALAMVDSGEITDGFTLSALLRSKLRGLL